jgi:hypothetical protein
VENINKDVISIDDICLEQGEFYQIFSIMSPENALIWEKSFNNLILTKLDQNLNRIAKFPEEAYTANPISLVLKNFITQV